jgi:transposase
LVLDAVETQVTAVDRHITAHQAAHTEMRAHVQWLTAIVGIGMVTATKVLAEVAAMEPDESAKAAAADVGVTPSHCESGTSVRRRPRMSKGGNASLRAARSWPAITAIRSCPAFKAFAERLAAKGKPKKVSIGAVMRKLVHVISGVLKHKTPYDPAKVFGPTAAAT